MVCTRPPQIEGLGTHAAENDFPPSGGQSFMRYVGHLSRKDPLYGYLRHDILPRMEVHGTPDFRVHKINASRKVYLYKDKHSHARVVGKFFGDDSHRSHQSAYHTMKQEYHNLKTARGIGFVSYPHYVARPLGYNAHLSCVLVAEYCDGTPLDEFLVRAIREGARDTLLQKLTALAYFLAAMHNRTANGIRVDFSRDGSYLSGITNRLRKCGYIGWRESEELCWLKDRWLEKGFMWEDQHVLVHGDLTPTNILFGDGLWVIAVDLERMKRADRVSDVGRVCGEIKHFFMQYGGNKDLAEPFIGHFLGSMLVISPIGRRPLLPSPGGYRSTWESHSCASPGTPGSITTIVGS